MQLGKRKKEPSSPPAAAAAAEAAVLGNDDLLREILVHLDHPTCLVHAALVSRRWLRHASDPAFLRRFRGLHPPRLLGLYVSERPRTGFVPLPHPRELDVVFRRAGFQAFQLGVAVTVGDCRNGRVLERLYDEEMKCYVRICSPLHPMPPSSLMEVDPASEFRNYMLLPEPEDGGNGMSYIVVVTLNFSGSKVFAKHFSWQDGTSSEVRTSAAVELPSSWMHQNSCALLVNSKCYMLGEAEYILMLDLASSSLFIISLPDGARQQQSMKNIELLRADGSGFYLIHLKGFEIHVWHRDTDGDNGGEWQLVDTICARQAIGHLAKPNWESILESGGPDVGVQKVGDNAEILLVVGLEVFYMQIKTRKVEKVFEMAVYGDPFSIVRPFTMVWPPSFPTLSDEQVDRGQDE